MIKEFTQLRVKGAKVHMSTKKGYDKGQKYGQLGYLMRIGIVYIWKRVFRGGSKKQALEIRETIENHFTLHASMNSP